MTTVIYSIHGYRDDLDFRTFVDDAFDLLGHEVSRLDGAEKALALAPQSRAQTFRPADEEANDQVGVFLHRLSAHPDAKAEKVQESLALHRILYIYIV
jgi:predicted glycosyl hydrolase (DUF1957 family)